MALKQPAYSEIGPAKLRVVKLAPVDQSEPLASAKREKPLNSFFVRMLISLLGVTLPFFIIAGLIPNVLARWGIGPEIVATVLLVGVTGLAARLMIRPVVALSLVAAQAESGDLSARVTPSGSTEMRQLGQTFNSMLDRLAGMQVGLGGEVSWRPPVSPKRQTGSLLRRWSRPPPQARRRRAWKSSRGHQSPSRRRPPESPPRRVT